ncbi:hypothetical protein EVAR_30651_1 [Eumeta japonica]|uniref:Uncharacterized protein n=1 Tax=Eumeta variegata TaxID=151549 RepID=A0A4C1VR99_EUMVA|nr:hypothetical protein EVAR_30651_1 [Eumeta japonica]
MGGVARPQPPSIHQRNARAYSNGESSTRQGAPLSDEPTLQSSRGITYAKVKKVKFIFFFPPAAKWTLTNAVCVSFLAYSARLRIERLLKIVLKSSGKICDGNVVCTKENRCSLGGPATGCEEHFVTVISISPLRD